MPAADETSARPAVRYPRCKVHGSRPFKQSLSRPHDGGTKQADRTYANAARAPFGVSMALVGFRPSTIVAGAGEGASTTSSSASPACSRVRWRSGGRGRFFPTLARIGAVGRVTLVELSCASPALFALMVLRLVHLSERRATSSPRARTRVRAVGVSPPPLSVATPRAIGARCEAAHLRGRPGGDMG